MGTVTLPAPGSSIYVDSNVLIYRVEAVQPYLAATMPLWDALRAGTHSIVTSELTVLEVLVKPIELNDARLQRVFRRVLYNTKNVVAAPLTRSVLERAAALRAATRLKTPDALHAATALDAGCALFVTNDPAFRRVPHLPVVVLREVVNAP